MISALVIVSYRDNENIIIAAYTIYKIDFQQCVRERPQRKREREREREKRERERREREREREKEREREREREREDKSGRIERKTGCERDR